MRKPGMVSLGYMVMKELTYSQTHDIVNDVAAAGKAIPMPYLQRL